MNRLARRYGVGIRDTVRLEAFSDAVFAIAITLLVLEIDIPAVESVEGESTLVREILKLWPSYLGYVISFLVIGIMWANHHNIFRFIKSVDHVFVIINTVFLLCIGFLPFPTALLAEHFTHSDESTATMFYAGAFFVTGIAFDLLWFYPTKVAPQLLEPHIDQAEIAAISKRFLIGPPCYLVTTIVAYFSANLALAMLAALALLYLIPLERSTEKIELEGDSTSEAGA